MVKMPNPKSLLQASKTALTINTKLGDDVVAEDDDDSENDQVRRGGGGGGEGCLPFLPFVVNV